MRKPFQLVSWLCLSVVLLSSLFLLVDRALAQSDPPPETPAAPNTLTISLSIPNFQLGISQTKILDLWNYTSYLGNKNNLVYTVTVSSGSNTVTCTLSGTHTLIVNWLPGATNSYGYLYATVSDGSAEDETSFYARRNTPPVLDFASGYYPLPDPVWGQSGTSFYLHRTSGDAVSLENYADDQEDYYDQLHYSIDPSTPISLNAVITQIDSYHYIQFSPTADMQGIYQVGVVIQDSGELTSVGYLRVGLLKSTYIPLVLRSHPPRVILDPIDNPDGDGDYSLSWTSIGGTTLQNYEVQYATAPDFSNARTVSSYSSYYSFFDRTPATYYWRVRIQAPAGETYPWSNVQSVTVQPRAYLYVRPLCAYDLTLEMWGNGLYFRKDYGANYCGNTWYYWRSIPTGSYNSQLTWIGTAIVDHVPTSDFGIHDYCIQASAVTPAWTICD